MYSHIIRYYDPQLIVYTSSEKIDDETEAKILIEFIDSSGEAKKQNRVVIPKSKMLGILDFLKEKIAEKINDRLDP